LASVVVFKEPFVSAPLRLGNFKGSISIDYEIFAYNIEQPTY